MSDAILGFQGEYRWLSNFHPCKVTVNGKEFPASEHAYMYGKLKEDEGDVLYQHIIQMSAREVKKWGQKIDLRWDWDDVREGVMYAAVWSKFSDNEDLKEKLLATGDTYIEETNLHKDTYWGVCDGKGQNRLGKMIMSIRNELKWISQY